MRKVLVNICRLVLAVTFILSGFVKAVDPLGTQYKLNDYLEAMHLGDLVPQTVTLMGSIALSTVEFCIGIFLLFVIYRRFTSRLALLVMSIMTVLTVWIYMADPVSDCGCFGDAVVLTNGQTLLKNIILLACAVIVAWKPLDMLRFISHTNQWIVINYTVLFILFVAGYALYDLPQFDFRPYHVGANIKEGMEVPEGAEQPQFETTFIMEKNGERREFGIDNYPDSTWTYIDTRTVQTKQGYVPPIHDFSITTPEGEELTEEILNDKGYTLLLISPHLEDADDSQFDLINQIYEYAADNDYPFYCLTARGEQGISRWRDITGA